MIKRLARIVGAYLVASQASGFALILGLLLLPFLGTAVGAHAPVLFPLTPELFLQLQLAILLLLAMGGTAGMFIMVLAFVPALFAIAVAEAARLRSAAFYAAAGAIGAIGCWAFFIQEDDVRGTSRLLPKQGFALSLEPGRARATVLLVLVVAVAGVIAGLVYWRIAGSSAGDGWRRSRTSASAATRS